MFVFVVVVFPPLVRPYQNTIKIFLCTYSECTIGPETKSVLMFRHLKNVPLTLLDHISSFFVVYRSLYFLLEKKLLNRKLIPWIIYIQEFQIFFQKQRILLYFKVGGLSKQKQKQIFFFAIFMFAN